MYITKAKKRYKFYSKISSRIKTSEYSNSKFHAKNMEEAMYRYVINVYVAVYVYIHGIVAKAKYDFFFF